MRWTRLWSISTFKFMTTNSKLIETNKGITFTYFPSSGITNPKGSRWFWSCSHKRFQLNILSYMITMKQAVAMGSPKTTMWTQPVRFVLLFFFVFELGISKRLIVPMGVAIFIYVGSNDPTYYLNYIYV